MKSCQQGVVFFGLGLSMRGLGHRSVEALLLLVRELNDFTRFYARRMRVQGDVTGADTVLAWQTGYPFSVNLGRGYPRFNPGEFSARDFSNAARSMRPSSSAAMRRFAFRNRHRLTCAASR